MAAVTSSTNRQFTN
jgi:hypothetical protein